MKYSNIIKLFFLSIIIFSTSGCFKDLNTIPLDEDVITSGVVYDNPEAYKQVLAKLYAGLSVSGQEGPSGQADIEGIDEGFGQYLRGFWYHQELTTDEALIGWNDQTILDFHAQNWTSADGFSFAFYSRIFYQIALCNEFMRETTDAKLDSRNVDSGLRTEIQGYRAEARFLRALSYSHALDIFRNVPFVTEKDIVGSFFPDQIKGPDLFKYIESDLLEIEPIIADARANEYGRADKGAVWALLAKLYLNAKVYTGTERYTDCLVYCKKIINAGYELTPEYQNLFLADNHTSKEIIFPVTFDGINTRTWGGMTFIIRAGIGGTMNPLTSGVSSGWGGTRTTKEMIAKFPGRSQIIVQATEGNTKSYPKVYIPGSFNNFDASDTKNSLSSPLKNKIFEGYKYFPEANTEFVITTIPSLAIKFGDNGADGTLEQNGANIVAGEAGLYYINVNLNNNTYFMEKRSFGIIGDATSGGWDSDIDMTWDPAITGYKININLKVGGIKFRANDDWAVNFGDTGADAILDQAGDDILIDVAGNYDIFVYLGKPDYSYQINSKDFDRRAIFYKSGQSLEISDVTQFVEGYAVQKFKNVTSTGALGSDADFPDTDFPMFRLADFYLMASESILRGGQGGTKADALEYLNKVRQRAFQGGAGNITESELTLDYILDERARELYWECHRRQDLVRFDKFSQSDYLWTWKGGTQEGASVGAFRNIFPIPSSDLGANPKLEQNTGY